MRSKTNPEGDYARLLLMKVRAKEMKDGRRGGERERERESDRQRER